MPDIKFEVGSVYENMKGAYEVVSIHRNTMVIRWANGIEMTTTVDLQQRILERMSHEKEVSLARAQTKPKSSKSKRNSPA